jgi:hypothetical protein
MNLPFRRRHHDDETAHDRARATWSFGMLEPNEPGEEAWLEEHLSRCGDCRLEREAYLEDRRLLRSLREQSPEPPRDLWARTAAAIERESRRTSRRGGSANPFADRLVPRRVRMPLGVLSGLLVVLVVVATSLAPRGGLPTPGSTPGNSGVAHLSPAVGPSPLAVDAAPLAWLQTGNDGSTRLVLADLNEVCPDEKSGCAPLQNIASSSLNLGAAPQALVGSPDNDQIVVAPGVSGAGAGSVLVVPVPTPPGQATSGPTANVTPSPTARGTARPTTPVSASPGGSAGPTPGATPTGARSIVDGVTVIGEMAYSPDGRWLAFSARPIDGSVGPDLYLWNVDEPAAQAVTTDHRTFFSGWFDGHVLASRVMPGPSAGIIGAGPTTSAGTTAPTAGASPVVLEEHPVSFIFDPATGTMTDFAMPDVWLPTVDPSGRFATYWSGTLVPDGTGLGWTLGTGRLVLDGWSAPLERPDASGIPSGPGRSTPGHAQKSPAASGAPAVVGPSGTPIVLSDGPVPAFEATFDPSGTRLAVWIADVADATVGTLHLVVLDRGRGGLDAKLAPLPSVRALHGFSIDAGRLAWVTPPGQDGNQSTVQVLGWSHDDFGQIQTVPAQQLVIVR